VGLRRVAICLTVFSTLWVGCVSRATTVSQSDKLSISVPRVAYSRGEAVEFTTTSKDVGNIALTIRTVFPKDREIDLLVDLFRSPATKKSTLDTSTLRPGIHRVFALLKDDGNLLVDSVSLEIAVREVTPRGVSLGIMGMPADVDPEVYFREWGLVGIDHAVFDFRPGQQGEFIVDRLDKGLKYSIEAIPLLHLSESPRFDDTFSEELPPEQTTTAAWAQILRPGATVARGKDGRAIPSPLADQLLTRARDWLSLTLRAARGLPGLRTIALDQDWAPAMRLIDEHTPQTEAGVGDYSEAAQNRFRDAGGLDLPSLTPREPGIVGAEDDAYLKWVQTIGTPGDSRAPSVVSFNAEMVKAIGEIGSPAPMAIQIPGGYAGELGATVVVCDDYTTRAPVLNTAFLIDQARARQGSSVKPIWVVTGRMGSDDVVPQAAKRMALNVKIALGKGARHVSLDTHEVASSPVFRSTVTDLCRIVDELGPFLNTMVPMRMPVAVLYSETTEAFQRVVDWNDAMLLWKRKHRRYERPWEHQQSFSVAYPSLLRAQVPVGVITEDDIAQGRLGNYRALVLVNHQYSTASLSQKIDEYKANGHPVFADESTVIAPEGTIRIPFDASVVSAMGELGLRRQDTEISRIVQDRMSGLVDEMSHWVRQVKEVPGVEYPVQINSDAVAYSMSENGHCRYLYLYNTDLEKSRKLRVRLAGQQSYVYDIESHRETRVETTPSGRAEFETEIPAGDWKIFLLSPQQIAQLRVAVERYDREIRIRVGVLSTAGLVIDGSHPLRVTVLDPKNDETPYSLYTSTDRGEGSATFQLANNELTGKWKIEVMELSSGTQVKQVLEIR